VKKNKLLTERQVALYRYLLKQDKFKNLREIILETDLYGSLENYEPTFEDMLFNENK